MIELVAHTGDVHIHKDNRLDEYRNVFEKFYKKLKEINPDRIVVNGDTWNDWLDIKSDGFLLLGDFFNNLSKISKVIVTLGNHDFSSKNLSKTDTIRAVTNLLNNNNIVYYDKTGFYEDENVVWCVWGNADKGNPWKDIPHKKDKTKTYIDLFHNPINNVKLYNGTNYTKNNLTTLKDLKGDISMLNDIHLFQSFSNDTKAFSSSLIQQNWGEYLDHHGFLKWSISKKSFEFIEIPNDHAYINIYIDDSVNYDNLDFTFDEYKYTDLKIHWKDYSSNINTNNEKKIRDYVKNNFKVNKIKFEKIRIYNDVISSKMLSESLDLNNLQVQSNIFKEYLEEQKYKKEDIDQILKIDDIINNRLNIKDSKLNYQWNIDKFWFSNFKSYGDNNIINWGFDDGIVQISGLNQQGKTTILDALTYILFGKTISTITPEKFGDGRYINNKRDLDYCLGGAIIDVDGEKFIIQRKTERTWNKNKTSITGTPTTIDFYSTDEISEKNKLTGDQKNKTQKKLDLILGDFKDFIRLSYTNADNLNDLLSETRSVFIDSVIRDAGYDIFEKKLEEFKQYRKELNEEKIVVDLEDSENKILDITNNINYYKENINNNKSLIIKLDKELDDLNIKRDELIKSINNIDNSLSNFDININIDSIKNYKNKIDEHNIQLLILEREVKELPLEFNAENLNKLKIKLKDTNDKISFRKEEISKIKNIILELISKKEKISSRIKELKNSEIKKLTLKISENDLNIEIIKNKKESIINDILSNINNSIQSITLQKGEISNKMKLLQKDGVNLKNNNDQIDVEIKELKNSKFCPTCGREFESNSEHLVHIEEKINQLLKKKEENSNKINKLLNDFKSLKSKMPDINNLEDDLNIQKNNLKEGIFSDEIKDKLKQVGSIKVLKQENVELKNKINEIEKDIFDNVEQLKENINNENKSLKDIDKFINENNEIIKNIENELKLFNIENIENDIEIEEKLKINYELRNKKISQKENITLTIENFNLKIKDLEKEIDLYNEYKNKIEDNKLINSNIDKIDQDIKNIKDNLILLNNKNIDTDKDILIKEGEIKNIKNKIDKFLYQKKKDELYKEYAKCVGRDGIPTFLLKKSIHLINKELSELLNNVDFTIFFDENLTLRMSSDNRLDVNQGVMEGSGKERTFAALALKIALRQINVKSKSSIIFLDECMGKLIGESVQEFTDFLEDLKNKVRKIVIIEHNHNVNYQILIDVKKDDNGISSLSMN